MKLKAWIHVALYAWCLTLILLQGHRIQQIQTAAKVNQRWQEEKLTTEKYWYDECRAALTRWQIVASTRGQCSDPRCIATSKKVICREVSGREGSLSNGPGN
jgi:hypothetical protein